MEDGEVVGDLKEYELLAEDERSPSRQFDLPEKGTSRRGSMGRGGMVRYLSWSKNLSHWASILGSRLRSFFGSSLCSLLTSLHLQSCFRHYKNTNQLEH